ncbi:MAG: ABC transporter permease [Janthinobacterium lividum]
MHETLRRFGRTHEARLLGVIAALFVLLSIATRNFLTLQNAIDLLTSYAFPGMLAAGLLVVLVSGGLDISFTAVASITQYLAVLAAGRYDVGWIGLLGVALLVGTLLGVVNALLVTGLRLASIIVTIAMLNVYFGLLMFLSGGDPINTLPDWFVDGLSWVVGSDAHGNPYILNMQMLGLVLCFVLTWVLLNRTSIGRQLRALGGNAEAAKRVGFNVLRLNMVAYGYMGFSAGLASLVQAQIAGSVVPNALVGRELDVLAAVVLGGASLAGGTGTVLGTILGLLLLAMLQNGLILLGVSSFWTQCFTGIVFLAAVAMISVERRRRRSATRRLIGATS